MNIEMSDHQKTVQIINLMPDWSIWGMGEDGDDIVLQIGGKETAVLRAPDYLFAEKWMFLAWRVLNWAMEQKFAINESCTFDQELWDFLSDVGLDEKEGIYEFPPAAAQRAWLDKVLELAIEAGKVTK